MVYHPVMPRPQRLLSVLLAVGVAGCAAAPRNAALGPMPLDSTFYISTRLREAGRTVRRLSDSLEYGLIVTPRPSAEAAAHGGELPFDVVDSITLSREEFVTTLRDRAGPEGFAVLYTHGFGTSMAEAWEQAAHARARSQGTQPWVVFTWPASDSWLAWPRNGNGLATSYRADSALATASRGAFIRAFGTVRAAVGSSGLLLFTHSMGGQLAGEAIAADDTLRLGLTTDQLRGIAFFAPDVEGIHFGDVLVPTLLPLTRRLVLYASSKDRALATAGMISKTTRAGRIPSWSRLPLSRPGLESVDMTKGTSASGPFRYLFGARHGVRHATAALFDMIFIVGGGYSAECREVLSIAARTAADTWKLFAGALPSPTAVSRCAFRQAQ